MKEELYRWNYLAKNYWKNRTDEQRWLQIYLLYPFFCTLIDNNNAQKVLDYGCADGEFINYFNSTSKRKVSLYAYDKAVEMRKLCSDNINDSSRVLNSLVNYKFDVIILNMVIQDVFNLQNLLTEVKKHLHRNGRIIASIPHPDHFDELSEKPTASHEIISTNKDLKVEKMYWSNEDSMWTYKYNRSFKKYEEEFLNAGLMIKNKFFPHPIEEGKCDKLLYEYNSKNNTVVVIELTEVSYGKL